MLTFNEEHEHTVLVALQKYNDYCHDKIRETERLPKHCTFWVEEHTRSKSALNTINRYLNTKEQQ